MIVVVVDDDDDDDGYDDDDAVHDDTYNHGNDDDEGTDHHSWKFIRPFLPCQEAHSHCIRMLSMKLSAYLLSSGHHHPYHYHHHHHHRHHDSVTEIIQCSTGKKHSIDTAGTSHVLF
jgi:hypothetical protein